MRVPIYQVQLVRDGSVSGDANSISNPRQAFEILYNYLGDGLDREHFVVMMLTVKNKPIGVNTVSIGSLNASIVHPREIFKPAILASAGSIMLCHNHPSGDPTPSYEDIQVTNRIVDAGKILGIEVRDHIIIGDGCFYSFRERGLL